MLRTAAAYFAGIHIGVGFCVARSDGNGQCEGLRVSGRATGTDSRAFSVCNNPIIFKPHRLREPAGKTKNAMRKMYLKNLFAAICCTVIPIGMSAQFSGSGSGTKDDPYRIFNADQLNQVRNFAGKTDVYFSLEADIDMTDWIAENNPSQGWLPIDASYSMKVMDFNGNGHTIKNLYINRPNTDNVGLFGYARTNGNIYDLNLENVNIVGKDHVGGILGFTNSSSYFLSLYGCTVKGEIKGNDYVGGVVGLSYGNTESLSKNSFYGKIVGHDYIGGIISYCPSITISDCTTFCQITGNDHIGGIAGYSSSNSLTITNCYSYNNINGNDEIGGIIGHVEAWENDKIEISKCYTHSYITGNDNLSGVLGYFYDHTYDMNGSYANPPFGITLQDCYTNSNIKGISNIGSLIGSGYKNMDGDFVVEHSYANNYALEGKSYVGGIIGNSSGYSNSYFATIKNNVSINKKLSANSNLYRIGNIVVCPASDRNLAWTLTPMFLNDVEQPLPDDSEENGMSIGLSSLKLQATYAGLGWDFADTWQIEETEGFPYFKNQTAPASFTQTLKTGNTSLSGQCTSGATVIVFIGDKVYTTQAAGNIWNLMLDEPLQAGNVVNIIVQAEGKMPSYIISQTVSLAGSGTESDPFVISTPEDMQAISSDNTENACYKLANDIDLTEWIETNSSTDGWIPVTLRGTLDGDGHTISGLWCNAENGGLFDKLVPGAAVKNVKVSIADGKAVKGTAIVGGIVAINKGTVEGCMVTGTIEGGAYTGGIAGQNNGIVSKCYISGKVTSANVSVKAGGIVGENQSGSSVSDCYSSADITTTGDDSYAAGIAGYNYGTIERCYSKGAISGYAIAGVCAYNNGADAKVVSCVAVNSSLEATKSALRVLGGFSNGASAPATTDNYAYEGMPVTVNNVPQKIYDDPLNGTTKTIDELYRKATYEALGWDMENIWDIDEGSSLPYFEEFSIQVSEISLNNTEATIERQSTLRLTATVLPENCRNNTLKWSSDNEEVATVDENGLVTAVSVGEANITATAVDGSGVTATCKVTVSPKLVTSVTLNKNELTIEKSFTAQLAATVAPDDADDLGLIWTSDNEEVATVDENGLVTAVSVGEANITATAVDGSGVTATCKVTVTPKLVTSVILDESELTIEKNFTEQLTATVAPDDADNLSLTWTSDNEEVATVDENGLVTAVGEGTATITATANDGSGVAASCVVTVTFIDGIADIETSKVTVLAANGRITVSGKEKDDTVSVYDTGGRLLYRGESDVIDVPRKAMYIVTVSGKNYKVIVP